MRPLLVVIVAVVAFVGSPASRPQMTTPYSDADVARRAGYEPQSTTRTVEHWVNPSYFRDGRELDRNRPESLMYVRTADSLRLVAEVFVLDHVGETTPLADGATWHHHSACLGPGGLGVPLPGGPCPPGTALQNTPEMLHVWIDGGDRVMNDAATFCRLTP